MSGTVDTIETLTLTGDDPRGWGEQHGEAKREDIQRLYEIRLQLTLGRTDLENEANVLRLAGQHLPVLRGFSAPMYAELEGIAAASGVSLEKLVLLNHYTDLRDLGREHLLDDSGCSVIYSPADGGALLGQTWDTHASATDFTMLLEVPGGPGGEGDGRTSVFTITGCLGMTGMTSWGLGITINNLNSVDARVGVVWPALVRECLLRRTAEEARDVVMDAPLGSGHHYVVADEKSVFGVETSGTKKKVIQEGRDQVHLHTNHCLDDEMKETAVVAPTSTTGKRYEQIAALTQGGGPATARALYDALDHVSADRKAEEPHGVATCGAFVMDLVARRALAKRGPARADVDPMVVDLSN
jgi:isopenicillin-N N-acyltransferase-like protein